MIVKLTYSLRNILIVTAGSENYKEFRDILSTLLVMDFIVTLMEDIDKSFDDDANAVARFLLKIATDTKEATF